MLEFVRLARFDGVLPCINDAGEVVRVNSVCAAPSLQFFERPAEVCEDLAVDVFDAAGRGHDRDQTGDRLDDEPKGFLTSPESRLVFLHTWILGLPCRPDHCSRDFATDAREASRESRRLVNADNNLRVARQLPFPRPELVNHRCSRSRGQRRPGQRRWP
jgi:hypothetical protein